MNKKFKVKKIISVNKNSNPGTGVKLLSHPGADNPKSDENSLAEEATRNRQGGGAAASNRLLQTLADIQAATANLSSLVTPKAPLNDGQVRDNRTIEKDFRKFHHPLDQSRNVPRTLDEIEHHELAKREVAAQLNYAAGSDTQNLSNALGISPENQRHAGRIAKTGGFVPSDSYRSAGDIAAESQLAKQHAERSWYQPDPDSPLPWYLRRR